MYEQGLIPYKNKTNDYC
ncbi:hypothetical protein LNP74_28435 [Klebsiella pneumoniae subsp. pneumoniae]|nr:hypothetical protein [Klebsiella pneumoniae subsp. pneumoniae]